jgi:hypothetical protein
MMAGFACILACILACIPFFCLRCPQVVLYILTSSYHSTSDFAAQIEAYIDAHLPTIAASPDREALVARVRLVDRVAQVGGDCSGWEPFSLYFVLVP